MSRAGRPAVAAARSRIAGTFGAARLHSAYVYGSIPRGTAVPGVSDLDLLVALRGAPTAEDAAAVRALEAELDAAFDRIDGVEALRHDAATRPSTARCTGRRRPARELSGRLRPI
ncbi:nucleotidyltransferase domain-containing protein [Streptomyces sp. NPDC001274]